MTGRNRTRTLFDWLNRVKADPELMPVAFMVAFEIGQHFSSKRGGAAWPSSFTISKNIGIGKTSVIRAVQQLRERGHLSVEQGRAGRGHSNQYRMSKPGRKPESAQVLRPSRKGPPADLSQADKRSAGDAKRSVAADLNHLEPSMGTHTASPKGERERSLALAVIPCAPVPDGGAQEGLKARFVGLYRLWFSNSHYPDSDDEAAAWKLYFGICCDDPGLTDEIDTAAPKFIAAVKAKGFNLPKLVKWLSRDNWRKEPPPQKPKRNAGKVSLAAIARDEGRRDGGDQ
jgi:biotin operon repressor